MDNSNQLDAYAVSSFKKIEEYITQTTGIKPSPEDIAEALSKFFVLKEIREFIELSRQENKDPG